jgi:predicted ATPase
LDQLVDAGLIFRRGLLPDATFLFKHALVQDAAYGSLLKSRRQHLHGRIAQTLEERLPDQASLRPELVASHYAQAGMPDQAIDYWDKAGRLAVERSAMAEAVVHFGKALRSLADLPKSPQRRSRELALQLALAGTLTATKGWASREAGEAYAHARDLCFELAEGPQLVATLNGLRLVLANRAEFAAARRIVEELLAVAQAGDDPDAKLLAEYGFGLSLLFRAEFTGALQHFRAAIPVDDRPSPRSLTFAHVDLRVAPRGFMAWTLLLLGSADQALAESQQSLALARKASHPYALGMALHLSCIFHQLRGDGTMLAERSDELVALATEQGFPHFVGSGTCFRGWATIALGGSISDAIGKIRDGLATKRATGAEIKVPYYLGLLAEANRRIDRTTEGLNLLREALELAERTDERWYEAELYRLRGEVLVAKSDSDGAELWFSRSLSKAQAQNAKLWELRASCSLAHLRSDQGKRAEARELLTPVYSWFTEGFDTPDLQEAKALLEELG